MLEVVQVEESSHRTSVVFEPLKSQPPQPTKQQISWTLNAFRLGAALFQDIRNLLIDVVEKHLLVPERLPAKLIRFDRDKFRPTVCVNSQSASGWITEMLPYL